MTTEKYKLIGDVLGDGYGRVELLDYMGGDLHTVNAARASYGRESAEFSEKDARLVSYLGDHSHQTPLRHTYFRLRVKAPEFVARQWYKHVVGSHYEFGTPGFNDQPWSEFSQRFTEALPEYYTPQQWRKQDPNNKQASIPFDAADSDSGSRADANSELDWSYEEDTWRYKRLLALGVAREQARIVMPLGIYTEWVWTVSLQAIVHFCILRDHAGAQWEIQKYAKVLRDICRPAAPESWDALERNHPIRLQSKIYALESECKILNERLALAREEYDALLALAEMQLKLSKAGE